MLNQDIKKKLTLGYVVFLIASFFFIRYVLTQDFIEVKEKGKSSSEVTRERYVNVGLIVYYREDSAFSEIHRTRLKNTESVMKVMEDLREDGEISYEITRYKDSFEIDHVNSVYPEFGEEWRVFYQNLDITQSIRNINPENDAQYELRLIRI